jgi:hypothetical protein
MADDKVLESESEAQEETGSPTPPPSIPSIDEQPSAQSPNLGSFVDALSDPRTKAAVVELLRPEWQKDDQSLKDSRLERHDKSIDGLIGDVDRLKSYIQATGGDVDRAVREMRIDDVLAGRTSVPASGLADDGNESQKKYATAQTQLALDRNGIAWDDPAYVSFQAQYGTLPAEQWIPIADKWADQEGAKRAKQKNIPSAAAASESGTVISVEGDEDIESLAQELDKLMALPVPVSAETMVARKEVRRKLTAKQTEAGLLDNIRITK